MGIGCRLFRDHRQHPSDRAHVLPGLSRGLQLRFREFVGVLGLITLWWLVFSLATGAARELDSLHISEDM